MNSRLFVPLAGLLALAIYSLQDSPGAPEVAKSERPRLATMRQPASTRPAAVVLKPEQKNLFAAIESGEWSALLEYLNSGDPNLADAEGRTLLYWAAMYGKAEAISALLKAGAKLDTQDEEGRTALMAASAENRSESVKLLLGGGAGVEVKNDIGQTALLVAVENSRPEIVDLLAAAGSRLDTRFGEHDFNAYLLASVNGDFQMMDRLVKLDPSLALAEDREGRTAAHWGCAEGNIEVAASVIRHGGRLDARDHYRETAFEYAAHAGNDACLAFAEEGGLRDHM